MSSLSFDWSGVFSGPPLQWLASGVLCTAAITVVAGLVATGLTVLLFALRTAPSVVARTPALAVIELFRNTPLLVQLLFWYFAAYNALPLPWRDWIGQDHPWATLPGGVALVAPEFLASAWGLALFSAVFMTEELRAGLAAVSPGQREAAASQGFSPWQTLRLILLPQALANAWQPLVGQYLNLMKLSSLASAIGLAEITYQVRQIESFNSHALEAFAAGTVLYLAIGLVLGQLLVRLGPKLPGQRPPARLVLAVLGAPADGIPPAALAAAVSATGENRHGA